MKVDLIVLDKVQRLNRTVQEEAVKEFQKLERYVPEASKLDLRLELIKSHRKGQTHYVHVAVAIPGEPKTFHAEALAEDFRTALDRIYSKTERHLHRFHDRSVKQSRQQDGKRKEVVGNWLHRTLSAPRRLLGGFRQPEK